jgi:hypothetical protein
MNKKVLLILLLVISTTGHSLTSTKESRSDDALTCTGLFFILTSIPEPKKLNHLYTKLAITMRMIYANLESDIQNKDLTNGEINKAKDKRALKLGKLYDESPEKLINEYIQCNAWREDIGNHFKNNNLFSNKLENDEVNKVFRNVPVSRKLEDISVSKERNDAYKSQVVLAIEMWNIFGRITYQDYEKYIYDSLKKFKPSIEKGTDEYNKGNYKEAIRHWLPLAEKGNASAQYNLGIAYYYGNGVLKDIGAAVTWYEKSAKQGCAEAQYALGVIYIGNYFHTSKANEIIKDNSVAGMFIKDVLSPNYSDPDKNKRMLVAKYWIQKAYENNNTETSKQAKEVWDNNELWKY